MSQSLNVPEFYQLPTMAFKHLGSYKFILNNKKLINSVNIKVVIRSLLFMKRSAVVPVHTAIDYAWPAPSEGRNPYSQLN